MSHGGSKRKSKRQNAAKSSTRHLLPVASMQILPGRLRRVPACEEGKKEGTCGCPEQGGNNGPLRRQDAAKSSIRHLLPVPSMQILKPVCLQLSDQSKLNQRTSVHSLEAAQQRALHRVWSALPVPSMQILHQWLAGCSRPSRARVASVHRGRRVQLSIAGPGCSIAVADCSCPEHCCARACSHACVLQQRQRRHAAQALGAGFAWAEQHCPGQLQSATAMEPGPAIDRCTPRPRWKDAPRACDGRMHHAPAMDGCTPRPRWMAAPRARDRRSQRPPWSASARARDGQLQPGPAIYSSTRARDRRLHSAPAMDGCNPRPRSTHPAPAMRPTGWDMC